MSRIKKMFFNFIFEGLSSMIIFSIIYAFVFAIPGGLLFGFPSGLTIWGIAFIYGMKKSREKDRIEKENMDRIKRIQKDVKERMHLFITRSNISPNNDSIDLKNENEKNESESHTKTVEINNHPPAPINAPRVHIDEANYLLDAYEIVEKREGGASIVFICTTTLLKDEPYVAVKVLKGFKSLELDKVKDWLYECHSLIMLGHHPNIVQIKLIHKGIHSPQIVMEYVKNTLDEVMGNLRGDTLKIINIGINVCDALIHANEVIPNFVHLDLKPQNILISSNHQAKVTDFGIIHSGIKEKQLEELDFKSPNFPLLKTRKNRVRENIKGTIYYMSPEQTLGSSEIDCRSDIYSLGCIFYELIGGEVFFKILLERENLNDNINQFSESIKKLHKDIPDEMVRLVYKCLAKRKENRFQSFVVVREELIKIKKKYFNLNTESVFTTPKNEETIISLIDSLIKIGDFDQARIYLKSITNESFWKYFYLGLCDSYQEHYEKSLINFKYSLKYASTKFDKTILFKELGYATEQIGDLKTALIYFKKCVSFNPNLGAVHADIARVNIKLGNNRKAKEGYKYSLSLSYDPDIIAKYAYFLIDIKEFDDAIRELKKSLLVFDDDMQIHIHLADAAIGKLVDHIDRKKPISNIKDYLSVAKKHSNIAIKNNFQIDKAMDILYLHDMIAGKL